jgi:transcriptional regulator with XRE-family HTH domain
MEGSSRRIGTLEVYTYNIRMSRRRERRASAEIASELRRWLQASGITQAEIARRVRVKQPQVSRILAGDFGARSGAARKLCRQAGVSMIRGHNRRPNQEHLIGLLNNVWDGTPEDAVVVSRLLQAAAMLRGK